MCCFRLSAWRGCSGVFPTDGWTCDGFFSPWATHAVFSAVTLHDWIGENREKALVDMGQEGKARSGLWIYLFSNGHTQQSVSRPERRWW